MANLTSTTITGTLDATSTITGPGSGISAINASNVSSGTLSNDRLDTVPTTKGGTGLTSIGSAGQVLTVSAPGSALEFADAGGGGVGGVINTDITSSGPGTFTANASTQFLSVEVTGAGGGGGGATYYGLAGNQGAVGGTTNFGSLVSATGGNGGQTTGAGSGGTGSANRPYAVAKGQTGGDTNPGTRSGGAGGLNGFFGNAGQGGTGGNVNGNLGNRRSGGGGGGGGSVFAVIAGPEYSPSIAVTVGAGGAGGNKSPGGGNPAQPGSTGSTGRVRISEYIS